MAGRASLYSLYNTQLATYTEEDTFDHKASEGFIKIYGLPTKTYHQVHRRAGANGKNGKTVPAAAATVAP